MSFVKLDCGFLDSSLWLDKPARDIFITALLMATPREYPKPVPQLAATGFDLTGWKAPAGWYGYVAAAGPGIIKRAGVSPAVGQPALARLGEPDADSRSHDYDGRRLVRIDGGYLVLNYDKYRQRDYTAADRMKRWRERNAVTRNDRNATRLVTQAEAEADPEADLQRGKKAPRFKKFPSEALKAVDHIKAEIAAIDNSGPRSKHRDEKGCLTDVAKNRKAELKGLLVENLNLAYAT